MFSIFKFGGKTVKDFSDLGADMHSHLLPAIDDGATSVEDSIRMITALQDMGFSTLFTTPHSIKDVHPNTLETLRESHAQVGHLVPDRIFLDYSSEYFLDEYFLQNVQEGLLRPLPGNRLLIEFSMVSPPFDLEQQFFDIQMKGYQIVLAHPERYLFFQKNSGLLSRLKDMDVEFQVNALSLGGYYGENAKQAAEKMIKKGWIDFVGTDAHHDKHIQALRKIPDTSLYQRLLDQGNLKNSDLKAQVENLN
jgi:tyrosine-protein phosphatase YwqE